MESMNFKINNRLEWVDFLKGIVIILVVIGHINRGFIGGNMFENINLKYIDFTIYSFHMPLMFILSGIVYATKCNFLSLREWIIFIKRKFISLYVPYFIFSYIMFGFKFVAASLVNNSVSINTIVTIPIIPYDIYWFLMCLLVVFVFYSFCDLKIKNSKFVLLISISIYIFSSIYDFNIEYINTIISFIGQNGIYFYLGKIFFENKINFNKYIAIVSIIAYISLNIILYITNYSNLIFSLILAILMSAVLIYISKKMVNIEKLRNKLHIIIYLG